MTTPSSGVWHSLFVEYSIQQVDLAIIIGSQYLRIQSAQAPQCFADRLAAARLHFVCVYMRALVCESMFVCTCVRTSACVFSLIPVFLKTILSAPSCGGP